jgi:ketosteroid isomerase-like protein
MPQNQSELIREHYDAFARADVPFVMGNFLPDLVWNEAENFTYADRNP